MNSAPESVDQPRLNPNDLWAKTGSDGKWHSLPYHLLDVAAAAAVLLERLPQISLQTLYRCFPSQDQARQVAIFLAGAHDVGKANRHFQAKAREQRLRLTQLGYRLPPEIIEEPARHGQATGAYLAPWLEENGWSRACAVDVALAIGGHHGSFFATTSPSCLEIHDVPWSTIGPALLNDLLLATGNVACPGPNGNINGFLAWIAGFVSVADWIGSNWLMTPWETGATPTASYFADARRRAGQVLDALKWTAPATSPRRGLQDLLPPGATSNDVQRVAAEIADDAWLTIIEAPTGEGKTEAAFVLAEPTRSQGGGVYFALPTMATANGLYPRVQSYLSSSQGSATASTRLQHSMSWLYNPHEEEPKCSTETAEDPGHEGESQQREAQDWFAGSKRALLAPYGVGTIDQALIGALRAKHHFVRLFALAGRTVVIDEVHAYDAYMSDILQVLLGWLKVLGCRVVLLSATLPGRAREALLHSWGCEGELPPPPYPAATFVDSYGSVALRPVEAQPRKPLSLRLLPNAEEGEPIWRPGAEHLFRKVATHGGMGALVLNTVRHAQEAFDFLSQCGGGVSIDLFHGRFTAEDRQRIEETVISKYGKHGRRDSRSILVATQVVEQSLDLDFDFMVSALAPIDLLIQRAGRLHRHRRSRSGQMLSGMQADERDDPVLWVIGSDPEALPSEIREPIYLASALALTYELLTHELVITSPDQIRDAVEAVYGQIDLSAAQEEWRNDLERCLDSERRHHARVEDIVSQVTIPAASSRVTLTMRSTFLEDDELGESEINARTRLEDMPSVGLVLLQEGDSTSPAPKEKLRRLVLRTVRAQALGKRLSELLAIQRPPSWRTNNALRFAHPVYLSEDGHFCTGSYEYAYSSSRGLSWSKLNG